MAAEMCRVSIRSVHREADLAVFAHLPLCELMPSVAAMLGDDVDGQDVRLGRVDGDVLDPAQSLAQNGVCDGEVLILTTAAERTAQSNFDLCDAVAQAVMRADPREPATHLPVATVAALWSAVAVAALLVRCVVGPAVGGVGIGCAGMASALAGALMVRRHRNMSTTLGLVGSAFAGLTALLAVPALPGFLLAMSAVSAASLGSWRILGFGTRMFLPLSGATMAAAAASLPVALGWLPTQYAGPILTTASVAILAVSPRLASRLSGLAPSAWPDDVARRAAGAHRILVDVVAAAAAASALGTLVTAILSERTLASGAFIAVVAATLLLRSRTHPERAGILMASAGVASSTFVGLVAVTAPETTTWLCGSLIVAAAVAVTFGVCHPSLSPAVDRVLAAVEFTSGAAVAPLACAAAGVFAAIRSGM